MNLFLATSLLQSQSLYMNEPYVSGTKLFSDRTITVIFQMSPRIHAEHWNYCQGMKRGSG